MKREYAKFLLLLLLFWFFLFCLCFFENWSIRQALIFIHWCVLYSFVFFLKFSSTDSFFFFVWHALLFNRITGFWENLANWYAKKVIIQQVIWDYGLEILFLPMNVQFQPPSSYFTKILVIECNPSPLLWLRLSDITRDMGGIRCDWNIALC